MAVGPIETESQTVEKRHPPARADGSEIWRRSSERGNAWSREKRFEFAASNERGARQVMTKPAIQIWRFMQRQRPRECMRPFCRPGTVVKSSRLKWAGQWQRNARKMK